MGSVLFLRSMGGGMNRASAVVLGLALAIHLFLLSALDLSDLPGPGSALWALDARRGTMNEGLASYPLRVTAPLLGLGALRLQQALALILAVWGAILGARALGGGSGALAGAVAACWGLVQFQTMLVDVGTTLVVCHCLLVLVLVLGEFGRIAKHRTVDLLAIPLEDLSVELDYLVSEGALTPGSAIDM